ncbi:MAG: hemolysin D [Candidatus Hydrogenedentota bacterium]
MMTVESPTAAFQRTFPAVLRADTRSDLSFRVSGAIAEVIAVEGQSYSVGELLARLDPRDFENRLAEARSNLASAEADLAVVKAGTRPEDIALLEAQLAAATARNDQALSDYNRQKQMYNRGLVAKSEFERSETAQIVASRDVDSATQQLDKARTGARPEEIQSAAARVETMRIKVHDAEAALDDTQLRAPFDGVVGTIYVDPFQEIQAKQTVLSLQNIGGIEVELQVPESLAIRRSAGGTLDFTVVLTGDKSRVYSAEFSQFSMEADSATQTYRLTLRMEAPSDVRLLPGMTAEVTVKAARLDGEFPLLVPVEAVGAEADGSAVVWLVDSATMQVRPQTVTTGALTDKSIEIVEGLKPGDTIATAGVSYLRKGMRVRPLES